MAGESARESAKRLREKAERQARVAEMFERGAEGEEATAAALAGLPAEEWTVFHDLRWPGRKFANVDHIVVGPPGVYVIDSKNWSGSIGVSNNVLRQNGRARETAVHGAAEAAMAVSGLARSVSPLQVHPVICFVRDEPVAGWARDVLLCSTSNVIQMLTSRDVVLSAEVRRMVTLELDAALHSATGHVAVPSRPRPRRAYQPDRPTLRRQSRRSRPVVGCLGMLAALVGLLVAVSVGVSVVVHTLQGVTSTSVVSPRPDCSCPDGHPVKAWTSRSGSHLYRDASSAAYETSRADHCFRDVARAQASGYSRAKR